MQHQNDSAPIRGTDENAKLNSFRVKVRDYRKQAGHTQNELADSLGLHPVVLSNKLNGTNNAYLTNPEIKQIVLALSQWQAITTAAEAVELLTLGGLSAASFSPAEWLA